ncbi:MAG: hypothetical protein HYY56_07360 [Candidatus Omnitrophica bacterium]|nr:hypothetical protein [Candidatus Omnitrophota bacterium]
MRRFNLSPTKNFKGKRFKLIKESFLELCKPHTLYPLLLAKRLASNVILEKRSDEESQGGAGDTQIIPTTLRPFAEFILNEVNVLQGDMNVVLLGQSPDNGKGKEILERGFAPLRLPIYIDSGIIDEDIGIIEWAYSIYIQNVSRYKKRQASPMFINMMKYQKAFGSK